MNKHLYLFLATFLFFFVGNACMAETETINDEQVEGFDDFNLEISEEDLNSVETEVVKASFKQRLVDGYEDITFVLSAIFQDTKNELFPNVEKLSLVQRTKVTAAFSKKLGGGVWRIAGPEMSKILDQGKALPHKVCNIHSYMKDRIVNHFKDQKRKYAYLGLSIFGLPGMGAVFILSSEEHQKSFLDNKKLLAAYILAGSVIRPFGPFGVSVVYLVDCFIR